ncbi:MAG: His-Xaa-Ser repeat protein HxsA [Rhodanobacter sp.]
MRKSVTVAGAVLSALHGVAHGSDNADRNKGLTDLAVHDGDFAVTLTAPLNVNVRNMYASHSSHSSHSSHASHSSGSSGIYRASPDYTPAYTSSAPAPSPAPTHSYSPGVQPLMSTGTPRPSGDQLRLMVMRVQAALYAKGYDPGAIDGELTESTKLALQKFQSAHGLAVTGKMTTQTMNALGVALTP